MSVLVINDEVRRDVKDVFEYSSAHLYYPGFGRIPGENKCHVAQLYSYRCVFSYTVTTDGDIYRHLSVSVAGEHYPNELAISQIAALFGFGGLENGLEENIENGVWVGTVNREDHCVVIAQKIKEPLTITGDSVVFRASA